VTEIPFHATRAGQQFYEQLLAELARINASLAAVAIALDKLAPADLGKDEES
jgi:hypothetical protein